MAYKEKSPQPVITGGTGQITLTNHGVLVGAGTTGITQLAVGTNGQVLIGATTADPAFATLTSTGGTITYTTGANTLNLDGTAASTGQSGSVALATNAETIAGTVTTKAVTPDDLKAKLGTQTNHGVLIGAGTTAAVTALASAATGSTLMGVTGADPAFTGSPSFSGSVTAGTTITATLGAITATAGDVVITAGNLTLPNTTNTPTGEITFGGNRFISNFGTGNTFIGQGSGNTTLSSTNNAGVGTTALAGLTSGAGNTSLGNQAGQAINSGATNVAIGDVALYQLTTGSNNVCVGYLSGANYTTSGESSNICINATGTAAESNVLRIGNGTGTSAAQLNKSFINGIRGITTANANAIAVLIDSAGQLGTVSSSIKFKDNVVDMADKSSFINKLRPVTFTFKDDKSNNIQWGLIAEEVNDIEPRLVATDQDGLPFSIKYHELPALLLNELQKLAKRISILEGK